MREIAYNPDYDFALNSRDELAVSAPIPSFIFSEPALLKLSGCKNHDEFDVSVHLPMALARWRYLYADAAMRVRSDPPMLVPVEEGRDNV
jgi:hypothetical protein